MKLGYGPVVIDGFFEELHVGYYDDDTEDDDGEECAVVYLGDMLLTLHVGYYLIPFEYIREVTTDDLWMRREIIFENIGPKLLSTPKSERPSYERKFKQLLELAYIDEVLMEHLHMARYNVEKGKGSKVFISHSSKDKQFAQWLSVDLANAGHSPWLDEWKIKAGESIPKKVSDGLHGCRFLIVILSQNSVSSNWVEREWQAKYWSEVKSGTVMVIPILLEDCEIPILLQHKKYADFTHEYNGGIEEVLSALLLDE